jgi:DHA2 family multidrug resistance protein
VGTAFLVTALARRAQFHQHRLADHLVGSNAAMQSQATMLGRYLHDRGGMAYSVAQGRTMAQGSLMRQLVVQATMLSYIDVIKCFAVAMLVMVPVVFLMGKVKGGRGGGGH